MVSQQNVARNKISSRLKAPKELERVSFEEALTVPMERNKIKHCKFAKENLQHIP